MYYVYILTNDRHTVFYTGITNDIVRRVHEHKEKMIEGFTKQYNVSKLVYFEEHHRVDDAIRREKRLKKWDRAWKIELIEKDNPEWSDLYDMFF